MWLVLFYHVPIGDVVTPSLRSDLWVTVNPGYPGQAIQEDARPSRQPESQTSRATPELPGTSLSISRQFLHDSHGCSNGRLSYVFSFSLSVISLESASKSDPSSLVVTCGYQ